jgi:hypothetical protein
MSDYVQKPEIPSHTTLKDFRKVQESVGIFYGFIEERMRKNEKTIPIKELTDALATVHNAFLIYARFNQLPLTEALKFPGHKEAFNPDNEE